ADNRCSHSRRAKAEGTSSSPAGWPPSARIDADNATPNAGTTWRNARRWSPPNTIPPPGPNCGGRSPAEASAERKRGPKACSTSRSLPGLWLAQTTSRSDVTSIASPLEVTLMLDEFGCYGENPTGPLPSHLQDDALRQCHGDAEDHDERHTRRDKPSGFSLQRGIGLRRKKEFS